jgi:competence protein ComEA
MGRDDGRSPFGLAAGAGRARDERGSARPDIIRRARALAVLLLLVASAMVIRAAWRTRALGPLPILVELQGAISEPGLYELPPGTTVREGLLRAGAAPERILDPFADLTLEHGYRVVLLADGSARIHLADERLLVGLPVDPNSADSQLLQQLPGIGPSKARAIIDDRRAHGPFISVDELQRVPGVGPATVERLRPFLALDGLGTPDEALGIEEQGAPRPGVGGDVPEVTP